MTLVCRHIARIGHAVFVINLSFMPWHKRCVNLHVRGAPALTTAGDVSGEVVI